MIALVAALNTREFAAATRALLATLAGVLLTHAAFLGPQVWLHDMSKPYPEYIWFMVAELALFALAVVSELYALIRRSFVWQEAYDDGE